MINWLLQSTSDHPDLARGVPPAGLLGEQEQLRFAELKTPKRRSDWLIGRWTAKHLFRSYLERQTGARPQLNTLMVANDPDGAPRVIVDCRPAMSTVEGLRIADNRFDLQPTICDLQLSISHCDGHAFCALSDAHNVQIGADIEYIEQRSAQFAEDYFTAHELAQVRAAQPANRDAFITLIWSAKEAALKALRLGLTVDTRRVSCDLGQPDRFRPAWARLAVYCAPELPVPHGGALNGWWRLWGRYVLTIVVMCCDNRDASRSAIAEAPMEG